MRRWFESTVEQDTDRNCNGLKVWVDSLREHALEACLTAAEAGIDILIAFRARLNAQ